MASYHNGAESMYPEKAVPQKRKSCLPGIALAISFTPVLLFLLTIVGYTMDILLLDLLHAFSETILLYSLSGILFFVASIVIGIIALCKKAHRIGASGRTLSIIAILWSLVCMVGIFWIGHLMNTGRFP